MPNYPLQLAIVLSLLLLAAVAAIATGVPEVFWIVCLIMLVDLFAQLHIAKL